MGVSIRTRITFWYTAFLIVTVSAVLAFLLLAGGAQNKATVSANLSAVVDDALSEIEYEDGELEIDDDIIFLNRGVYVSIYDASGSLLAGGTPWAFDVALSFDKGAPRTVNADGEDWYVYDNSQNVAHYGVVWVRGIASLGEATGSIDTLIRLAFIALPFLVFIAAVGGYLITRRALQPVQQITTTAEQIGESGDLSRRIGLSGSADEIHSLAAAFDGMFDKLERAFEKEKQFTADASHELRTPTAVIIAQSEFALEHAEEAPKALEVILRQARKISTLLSQLLMLARADKGESHLSIDTLDISELTEMVVLDWRERAAASGVAVHMELEPHILMRGDETMLMRMLINLIENAVRYNRPGGNVWVTLRREGNAIVGEVKDDGIGIAPDQQDRIWERFYQADRSRSGDGAGLGLSMVRWIAAAHEGSVTVDSAPEHGSTFRFIF